MNEQSMGKRVLVLMISIVLAGCGPIVYKQGDYFDYDSASLWSTAVHSRVGIYKGNDVFLVVPNARDSVTHAGLLTQRTGDPKWNVITKTLNQEELEKILNQLAVEQSQYEAKQREIVLKRQNDIEAQQSAAVAKRRIEQDARIRELESRINEIKKGGSVNGSSQSGAFSSPIR